MAISQKNRPIRVSTVLGEDVLLFYQMHGTEKLGELFEYELELLSENTTIDPDKMLGENVTVGMSLPDGQWRYFNGYVARFGQHETLDGFAVYHATLRPWLWFLTRAANCRIFQNINVPEIVKQVFRDQGFSDFTEKLSGDYAAREYCVQYRETDFNFISRLLEEEGIYFYFTHENGKHHLVLADSPSAHDKFPGYEKIPYHPEQGGTDKSRTDHIHEWTFEREVQTGVHAQTDYDFKKPRANLLVQSSIKMPHAHSGYERFDYPGRYVEVGNGENLVRSRIEDRRIRHEGFEGRCNARGLCVGSVFRLDGHRSQAQNRDYLVTSAKYRVKMDGYIASATQQSVDDVFQCSFIAIGSAHTFRPEYKAQKTFVHGPQTAIVVGPEGEEIHTDQYGRVKVQFHWDRYGKNDENSSCWIRVAQPWAGKNWGMVALPRIGQEVVVDFLEGDPDRPLITGSVYNNNQMPPYILPSNKTQTGIKSRSSKGGQPAHFNEIRFEDKKGQEHIYFHAEKDLDMLVEHDRREWVQHDRHLRVNNDRIEEVRNDSSSKVDRDRTEATGRKLSQTIGEEHTVKVGDAYHLTTGKSQYFQSGRHIVLESGQELTIRSSGGFIKIDGSGITIQGKVVNINTGGSPGTGFPVQANVAKNAMLATDVNNPSGSEATEEPPKEMALNLEPMPATQHAALSNSMADKVKQAATQGLPTIPLSEWL